MTVTVEQDQIVIRRAGDNGDGSSNDDVDASSDDGGNGDGPELDPDRFDA